MVWSLSRRVLFLMDNEGVLLLAFVHFPNGRHLHELRATLKTSFLFWREVRDSSLSRHHTFWSERNKLSGKYTFGHRQVPAGHLSRRVLRQGTGGQVSPVWFATYLSH